MNTEYAFISADENQLRSFLLFVTGLTIPRDAITVTIGQAGRLPEAQVCTNTITVPNDDDEERFIRTIVSTIKVYEAEAVNRFGRL
jgi:hypothetical protein